MVDQAFPHREHDTQIVEYWSYEQAAMAIFEEAQLAAALIPESEFEDVFEAAPDLEFHHRYVQSLLTWIWYEVHENEVPLEDLPQFLGIFFTRYEGLFATYWL
jgi:hypothetical protein